MEKQDDAEQCPQHALFCDERLGICMIQFFLSLQKIVLAFLIFFYFDKCYESMYATFFFTFSITYVACFKLKLTS